MPSILIIDDENSIRTMLEEIFKDEGFSVTLASDGEEGIKSFKKNPADVVVTDIIMPNKEGLETIIELKKNNPDLKILAMSGGGRMEAESYFQFARKFGADATIEKPFRQNELVQKVAELLS